MECFCNIICDTDGDWIDFDEEWKVAGKSLRCTECGSIIKKGEKYLHTTGVWCFDYSAYKQNHKTCVICDRIKRTLADCVSYSLLWQELHSCLDIPFPEDYDKRLDSTKELSDKEYEKLEKQIYAW